MTTRTRSSALRQAAVFLAITYALALAIAIALPRAGIAPLISIFVPVVAVAITVLGTLPRGQRRAAWAEVGFGLPSWRALLVAVVAPVVIIGLSYAVGVWYGWLRLWSGSIWPVSLSHSAFNNALDAAAGIAIATSPAAMAYTTTETGVVTMLIVLVTAVFLLTRRAADFRLAAS